VRFSIGDQTAGFARIIVGVSQARKPEQRRGNVGAGNSFFFLTQTYSPLIKQVTK